MRIDRWIKKVFVFLLMTNIPLTSYAVQQDGKFWSLITINGSYGRIVYYVEPQLRLVYPGVLFQQFLGNMGIGYAIDSSWQLWGGQSISKDSQDAVPGSLDEYRLWQQILWKHVWPKLGVVSRTRLEERKSLDFPDWAYRIRERITFTKPITPLISLVVSDEIFVNLNNASWIITDTLDQNRAFIGIEQRLTNNTFLGVGYMNQYLSTPIPQADHVLWINWRIDLENKP